MPTTRLLRLLPALAALAAASAQALPVSFSGAFSRDDEVRVFAFAAPAAGVVTIETFGYAGGIDANGNAVAAGGFDPVLALFDAAGTLVEIADDGASRADPVNGNAFDAKLVTTLAAGSYFVALTQYDNYAVGPGFGDGFLEAGHASYTAAYGCSAHVFCDLTGQARSGQFALSITTPAPVPEPGRAALLLAGGAALLVLGRRRLAAR